MIEDAFDGILFPLFIGVIISAIAYRRGFFKRPTFSRPPIFFPQLAAVFGIYLGYFFVLATFLHILIFTLISKTCSLPVSGLMNLQFFIGIATALSLFFYVRTNKPAFTPIFKHPSSSSSRLYDFGLGMITWLIAFPYTVAMNRLCDFLLYYFLHFEHYEQAAIRYLKKTLESPSQLTIALISVVVIAPIIEEILFRGTLQQYLKRFLSTRAAILLTSAVFACFHFSFSQQLGNLAIIPSLFLFACFLGYIYERQGSIYASIGLHSTFNLISSLQILFFGRL